MAWRFRQSFKIIPGVRLNLSKSGLSLSVGGAPFTVNVGSRAAYATASIPGTGISLRHRFVDKPASRPEPEAPHTVLHSVPASSALPIQEIRSASTERLTSDSLRELKGVIQTAYEEHEAIDRELPAARQEEKRVSARFWSWKLGHLCKNLFKKSFSVRKAQAEIALARVRELEEQLDLTSIAAEVQLADEPADAFFRMRDDFAALADCAAIWDINKTRLTDRVRERTAASMRIGRDRVKFSLKTCDLIRWDQPVPHLQNANGGDLFIYPGFILYRATKVAFSVIAFDDVAAATDRVHFQEEDPPPSDSKQIGETWAKVNKDGSPDRRFANNYKIPVVEYGQLTLQSDTGLWEVYQVSNPAFLERFAKSWKDFVASIPHEASPAARWEQETAAMDQLEDDNQTETAQPRTDALGLPLATEIHFECPACTQPIAANTEAAGQEFHCPQCGASLTVPQA